MTRNQLQYHELLQSKKELGEQIRHNRQTEAHAKAELAEEKRQANINAGANYIKAIGTLI